jgi:hypothetical protein
MIGLCRQLDQPSRWGGSIVVTGRTRAALLSTTRDQGSADAPLVAL